MLLQRIVLPCDGSSKIPIQLNNPVFQPIVNVVFQIWLHEIPHSFYITANFLNCRRIKRRTYS